MHLGKVCGCELLDRNSANSSPSRLLAIMFCLVGITEHLLWTLQRGLLIQSKYCTRHYSCWPVHESVRINGTALPGFQWSLFNVIGVGQSLSTALLKIFSDPCPCDPNSVPADQCPVHFRNNCRGLDPFLLVLWTFFINLALSKLIKYREHD